MTTKRMQKLIETTKRVAPGYFEATCMQRLKNGAGSCFEGISSVEEMEEALKRANWKQDSDENVSRDCEAYVTTDIPKGRFGLVEIATLSDGDILIADDRKGTGKVSLTVVGKKGEFVPETYLIVGKEKGEDVIFTFHPGRPIRESKIQTTELPHGSRVSKEKALEMGFEMAKLV